ncbi:MAG: hypothetical protein ACRYFB_11995 [Janthinobacterium lividum]
MLQVTTKALPHFVFPRLTIAAYIPVNAGNNLGFVIYLTTCGRKSISSANRYKPQRDAVKHSNSGQIVAPIIIRGAIDLVKLPDPITGNKQTCQCKQHKNENHQYGK